MGFLQTEALLNRGPFGAVKKGIQTLSDLFEPYAILQDFYPRTGIYPQELRAVAPIWLSPSISGRRKVLDMFRVISEDVYRGFNELQRGLALYEFEVNYDEKMGGFRDTSSRRFGEKGLPPIVYATENAIGVARHLVTNIEEGQPLGYANAVAIFGEEKVDGVINFIKKSQDQSGGFHHNPESVRLQPSVV